MRYLVMVIVGLCLMASPAMAAPVCCQNGSCKVASKGCGCCKDCKCCCATKCSKGCKCKKVRHFRLFKNRCCR